VVAPRSVGRVDIRERNGRLAGYGTDSLVSPQLVLTNHHVLPDAESAGSSTIEFIFQEGVASRVRLWSFRASDSRRDRRSSCCRTFL
jgi:endonuclease G, mitochondrial